MKDPGAQLAKYRNQIFRDFSFLLNTRLRFLQEYSLNENRILWDVANGGVTSILYQSLFDNLIVTLTWLYSESKEEKRSLFWYLNNVKQHTDVFSDDEIEEQFERINKIKVTIEKVRVVRHNWIAHRGVAAFNDPEGFLKKNEIRLQDLQDLVGLAEEIVGEHFERFEDTQADFGLPMIGIERLTSCAQAKDDLHIFVKDIMTSGRQSNANEIKIKAVDSLLRRQKIID